MLALAAVAAMRIDMPSRRTAAMLVAGIGMLLLVRMGVIAVNWAHARQAYAPVLAAIDHVQPGSRLAVLYGGDVFPSLQNPPMDHLGNMAVAKRNVYVNSLFAEPGQQPLRVKTGFDEKFSVSPSQTFRMEREKIGSADPFRDMPLQRFDYVLLMNSRYFVQDYPASFRLAYEAGNVKLFEVKH
jgi:hypothetical protein